MDTGDPFQSTPMNGHGLRGRSRTVLAPRDVNALQHSFVLTPPPTNDNFITSSSNDAPALPPLNPRSVAQRRRRERERAERAQASVQQNQEDLELRQARNPDAFVTAQGKLHIFSQMCCALTMKPARQRLDLLPTPRSTMRAANSQEASTVPPRTRTATRRLQTEVVLHGLQSRRNNRRTFRSARTHFLAFV